MSVGVTGTASSLVGGLELRLAQLKIDDETMYNIVGMIAGDLFAEGSF